ncbi:MAG: ComEC/Rec2 family competence protein, partial [Candidatus Zixiibacteriota bacterium]
DYARYLGWKNIFGIVYLPHPYTITRNAETPYSVGGLVGAIRSFILGTFNRVLEPEQAALSSGFLIGETSGISRRVYTQFRNSGTLHLLAVSGSNVAVALLTLRLFMWPFPLGRKARHLILILGAALFCYVAHTDPSVVRATIMISLFLIGRMMQRRIDYHNLIAAAGLLILIWNPQQLFSVGFQLSFVVAWALILFVGAAREILHRHVKTLWFRFGLLPLVIAGAAQLSATPIILYYFGSAPVWSSAANFVTVPVVSAAVSLSLFTLAAEFILPSLGSFFGSLLNLLLEIVLELLEFFGAAGADLLAWTDASAVPAWGLVAALFLAGAAITNLQSRRALVWTLALAPVFAATITVIGADRSRTELWVFTARGGLCALAAGSEPILFLADLEETAEAQFSYLVGPQLRRNSVVGRMRIVQLSADHSSAMMSLMVADSFTVRGLTVTDRARRLMDDALERRGESPESFPLMFSSELDDTQIKRALTGRNGASPTLAVGRSVALFRDGPLRALLVSSRPQVSELKLALAALDTSHVPGARTIIILAELNSTIVSALERRENLPAWRALAPRPNRSLSLSPELSGVMSYLLQTGAIRITQRD